MASTRSCRWAIPQSGVKACESRMPFGNGMQGMQANRVVMGPTRSYHGVGSHGIEHVITGTPQEQLGCPVSRPAPPPSSASALAPAVPSPPSRCTHLGVVDHHIQAGHAVVAARHGPGWKGWAGGQNVGMGLSSNYHKQARPHQHAPQCHGSRPEVAPGIHVHNRQGTANARPQSVFLPSDNLPLCPAPWLEPPAHSPASDLSPEPILTPGQGPRTWEPLRGPCYRP